MTETRAPLLTHDQLLALQERNRAEPHAVVLEATALLGAVRQAGDSSVTVRVLTALGSGLLLTGEHDRAVATLDEALALAQGDPPDEARVLSARLSAYIRLGLEGTVDRDVADLTGRLDALGDPRERVMALNTLAGVCFRRSDASGAGKWLDAARRCALQGGDRAGATLATTNAALLHVQQGQYGEAVTRLREALQLSDSPHTAEFVAGQIAFVYTELGQHAQALQVIDRHLENRPLDHLSDFERVLLTNRAEALIALGRPGEAGAVIEAHALHVGGGPRLTAEALDTLGRAYALQDRPDDARALLTRSLAIFAALDTPRDQVRPLLNLAELELPRHPERTVALIAQARALLAPGAPDDGPPRMLQLEAQAHAALGDHRRAYALSARHAVLQGDLNRQQERQRLEVAFAELEHERTEATARVQREALRVARQEVADLHAQLEARVEDRTRELQTANEELRAFARSVSHYLRTPMQLIVGHAALLEQLPRERQVRSARTILDSTERMAEVLDGLLSYATRGGTPVTLRDVELEDVVRLAWRDQAPPDAAARLDVRPLPAVQGDPAALRVAFGNLLHNALKFTRECARPVVSVSAREEPGAVIVEVRDNGVGFDPADAPRLFGAFTRLPTATRFEGLGLGLADVWRIVIAHGGHVRAEGRPGHGAAFFITLPAAGAAAGGGVTTAGS